jgi:type I restriction enzyme M protein
VDETLSRLNLKPSASELKLMLRTVSWRVESAPPVVAKVYKRGKVDADPIHGRYELMAGGKRSVVEYEPDSELRDTEQVPLPEPGGIDAFFRREVRPHVPDAWIDPDGTKIGYEISFTRHFYRPKPLRTLEEIRADILAVRNEAEGLLDELVQGAAK